MKKIIVSLCGTMLAAAGFAESGPLTLEQALELARQHSPELRAARLQTQAAEKAVDAAGRWFNPKLEFEAEGVGGDLDGFNDTEYTIGLSQKFQRGGKQKSEREVAQHSIGIAFQAESEKELELLAKVRLAFIDVVSQQEIDKVRSEQKQLGTAFVKVAQARYEAGGASQIDVVQAELQLEEIILSQTCCFGDLIAARTRLASLIGIAETEMEQLEADYYTLETIEAASIADSHPALLRMDARIATVRAQAGQAKAKDAADITLGAGYRYEAAGDVNTFVLGASMPLNFIRPGRVEEAATLLRADALLAGREELHRTLQRELSVITALYTGCQNGS